MDNPVRKRPDRKLKPVPKCCIIGTRAGTPATYMKEVLCREVRYDQTEPG